VAPHGSRRPVSARLIASLTLVALAASCTGGGPGPSPPPQSSEPVSPSPTLVDDSDLLPDPLPLPPGDPDQIAAALAADVVQGGDSATSALLAAIGASGIAVVDAARDEAVTLPPAEPNLGLAFQAGEVVSMARLEASGYQLTMDDLAELYRHLAPANAHLDRAPVDRFIVSGVRAAAKDDHVATSRFWGRFVVELGRQRGAPLDAPAKVPGSTPLDAVQVMFMLLRVAGDLRTLGEHGGSPAAAAAPAGDGASAGFMSIERDVVAAGKPPCNLGESAAEVLDITGVTLSWGFEKYIDYVAEELGHGSSLGTYAEAIPYINGALALLKFIAVVAAFQGKVELKDGPPLRRHREKPPGEQRELVLTVRMNTGNGTFLNCVRTVFNLAGLDISLPDDGPIADARVEWDLLEGGDVVRFCAVACGRSGNAVKGTTNEEGEASTVIEGLPRPRVVPASADEVTKTAGVRASVNLKPAKLFRDIWDAIATVLVGGPGAAVVFPTELLYRVGAFGAGLKFDVLDYGERWHIDMKIVSTVEDTNAIATWVGDADVDVATGEVTGSGNGTLNGHISHCIAANKRFAIDVDIHGSYGVTFGGTKEGDRFDLSVRGVDPDAGWSGNAGPCGPLVDILMISLNRFLRDPAGFFGVDVFSFNESGTYRLQKPVEGGTVVLTLTANPVKS
jgi:hypothetical protein